LSSSPPTHLATVDEETFRKTCSRFATGIAIATVAETNGQPFGITVNSFTSVSCAPPLVLVCIDYRSSILPHFRNTAFYGINVLDEGQRDLSIRFSNQELDRFENIAWHRGHSGSPMLDGVLAQMECRVTQTVEAGDHAIFIGEVIGVRFRDGLPLLYFNSSYWRP
jgi:3-hydroxy-9,10-secoandrosta-1,3,5(10)-triene-9,17-dione monooxygenase reductase component